MLTAPNAFFTEVDDIGLGVGPMWAPILSVENVGDSKVKLSWPQQFTDFQLQSSSTLAPDNWTNIATTTNSATLSVAELAAFFRLRK